MSDNENRYVAKISKKAKEDIINSSVAKLDTKPTLNATEMKMRFVAPIVNTSNQPCLADEVDRVAAEANDALVQLNEQADKLNEEISSIDSEIEQIQIDLTTVKEIEKDFRNLDGKVRYDKASSISVSVDPKTYVATFTLHADGGMPISTASIDLPTEELVEDGYYDEAHGNIVLMLRNKNKINVPVRDLVDGLVSTSQKGAPNGVATLDENGKVPKEQLPDDIGGGIDDEALKDYVKFTDYATVDKAGVIKYAAEKGITVGTDGVASLYQASKFDIDNKKDLYKPITPFRLDYAVKVGMTTNTETWTDEDKAAACETIGALKTITKTYGLNVFRVYCIDNQGRQQILQTTDNTNVLASKKYVDDNKGTKLYKHVIYHEDDGGYPTNETIAISLSNTPYTSHSQISADYLNGTILTLITSGKKVCGMSGTSAFFVDDSGFAELNFFGVPIVNDTITAL